MHCRQAFKKTDLKGLLADLRFPVPQPGLPTSDASLAEKHVSPPGMKFPCPFEASQRPAHSRGRNLQLLGGSAQRTGRRIDKSTYVVEIRCIHKRSNRDQTPNWIAPLQDHVPAVTKIKSAAFRRKSQFMAISAKAGPHSRLDERTGISHL